MVASGVYCSPSPTIAERDGEIARLRVENSRLLAEVTELRTELAHINALCRMLAHVEYIRNDFDADSGFAGIHAAHAACDFGEYAGP